MKKFGAMIRDYLYKWALSELINKKGASRISLTSNEAINNDCYWVYLTGDGEIFALLESIEPNGNYKFSRFGKTDKPDSVELSYLELIDHEIKITHFHGYSRIEFNSFNDFVFHQITRLIYLKIRVKDLFDNLNQYLFNKRSLKVRRRYELLKHLVETYGSEQQTFGVIEVLTSLHTIRIFIDPRYHGESRRVSSILNGFVDTGELRKINHDYQITGNAFRVLSDFEEQDIRHKELNRAQILLVILTAVLAFASLYEVFKSN